MKKIQLLIAYTFLATFFLLPLNTFAAIGFDQSENTNNVNLTTVNTTVNVTSSQSNLILIAKIFGERVGALTASSVQYGGAFFTQLVATTTPKTNSSTYSIWYLVNPATGSGNATTTFSASASNFGVCYESYYDVNQTAPFDASGSQYRAATTTLGTVSTTLTTLNTNDWILSFAADSGGAGPTSINPNPTTGDTATCAMNTGGLHFGAAYRLIPTTGATSTAWNQGTSTWYGMAAGSMVPFTSVNPSGSNANSHSMSSVAGIFSATNVQVRVSNAALRVQ